MRVLVVEDQQDVGDVFLDYLLELGHQPLLVRTAEAALGKLVTERPDAIIVDVNLPGMSGIVPPAPPHPRVRRARGGGLRRRDGESSAGMRDRRQSWRIRLSGRAAARPGIAARLTFTPPDGGATLTVMGLLVRADLGGYTFSFLNLKTRETERLQQFVARFV